LAYRVEWTTVRNKIIKIKRVEFILLRVAVHVGVIRSDRLAEKTKRAAAFKTDCRKRA